MQDVEAAARVASLTVPGEHVVDSTVTCVMTRFGLRSPRFLARSYREYQRVTRAAQRAELPELLRHAFLVENPTTWYSFSVWRDAPTFSADVPDHIEAARKCFGWLNLDPDQGPELWSTKWRLTSVTNNLYWDGFDLRTVLAHEPREKEMSPWVSLPAS